MKSLDASKIKHNGKGAIPLRDEGYPGYLTEAEYEVLEKFHVEVSKRDEAFRSTVFSFGSDEPTAFALCRWLRARKFDLPLALQMVDDATAMRATPAKDDFYPDAQLALGVEPSVYIRQYPQLYSGHAKGGFPLFISKPGVLNTGGIECITTIEGILRYHWHAMIHDFGNRLRELKASRPDFERFEVVCIIDLENLAVSNVGKRPMNIIKVQSEVDSLCFPETLNRFVIVNAPGAFSMLWGVIKGWIDARTAAKVEIHSHRKKWEKRLLELVDPDQLPSDYGGKARATNLSLEANNRQPNVKRQYVNTLAVCKTATSETVEAAKGEEIELTVFTRSLKEGKFTLVPVPGSPKVPPAAATFAVKHLGKGIDEEDPTRYPHKHTLKGPLKFNVKVECNTGSWSSENFTILCKIRDPSKISAPKSTPATGKAAEEVVLKTSQEENRDPAQDSGSSRRPSGAVRGVKIKDDITDSFKDDFVLSSAGGGQQQCMVETILLKQRRDREHATNRRQHNSPERVAMKPKAVRKQASPPLFTLVDAQDESAVATGWSCGAGGMMGLWRAPN